MDRLNQRCGLWVYLEWVPNLVSIEPILTLLDTLCPLLPSSSVALTLSVCRTKTDGIRTCSMQVWLAALRSDCRAGWRMEREMEEMRRVGRERDGDLHTLSTVLQYNQDLINVTPKHTLLTCK